MYQVVVQVRTNASSDNMHMLLFLSSEICKKKQKNPGAHS